MTSDVVLAQRVAKKFIEASAPIVIKEVGDKVEVSGPYDKMQGLIPYLRGKFDYRGQDRTWWTPKAKMTPLKMKNLQKRVNEINGVSGEPAPSKKEETEAEVNARREVVKGLFLKAMSLRVPGISFSKNMSGGVQLTGSLYDLQDEIRKAGGDYDAKFSQFHIGKTNPEEFEKLLVAVDHQGDLIKKNTSALASKLPRNFQHVGIGISISGDGSSIAVTGKTFDYRTDIKSILDDVFFQRPENIWVAPLHKVNPSKVEKLVEYFMGLEAERAEKWKAEKAKPEAKRPNRRGDNCLTCGEWVAAGDGYLVNHWDNDEDELVYKVVHADPKICEEVKERARIRREEARTKNEAKTNLRRLCEKSEYYVPGTGHKPQGEQIWIDKTALGYGGGSWVVIEPGEQHFWFVKNNGADGDDWSHNNVSTGGAGAIGYRLPYTDEAKVLIEVAKVD